MFGTRSEYVRSTPYKMICILAGYRRLSCTFGVEFVKKVRELWAEDGEEHPTIDGNFVTLIESGFVSVGEKEVRAYSDFICSILHYPQSEYDLFYDVLKSYCEEDVPDNFDDMNVYNQINIIVNAIAYIDEMMKKSI